MRRWVEHNTGTLYAEVPDDQFGFPDEITTSIDVTDLIPLPNWTGGPLETRLPRREPVG